MTTIIAAPSSIGNQPPLTIFKVFEANRATSINRKKPVATMQRARFRCHLKRMTKKVSTVVANMVAVTAMP